MCDRYLALLKPSRARAPSNVKVYSQLALRCPKASIIRDARKPPSAIDHFLRPTANYPRCNDAQQKVSSCASAIVNEHTSMIPENYSGLSLDPPLPLPLAGLTRNGLGSSTTWKKALMRCSLAISSLH